MTQVRRPRVALVAHGIHDGGGMERAFAELIRRANGRFEFEVFAAELAPELRPLVSWHRIRVPRRPIPLKFVLFFVRAALPVARADADLVHVLGAIVPNRADIATVHHCHAGFRAATGRLASADAPALRRLNTAIQRLLANLAEKWSYRPGRTRALAAVSRGVLRELEAYYPGIPTVLTPNGVDTQRFRPDRSARNALRTREGMVESDVVALFVGGNWDLKGLAIAIEAVAAAGGELPLHLWVVGRGDVRRFGRLGASLNLSGRVRFFGACGVPERYYQAADIFVLPTEYETFSLVAHEAASCGLPVVATRVSGIEDLVGDGKSGLLVPRAPEAIAGALASLAGDRALRNVMGRCGRIRAASFTWDASARSVVQTYEQLLDRAKELAA